MKQNEKMNLQNIKLKWWSKVFFVALLVLATFWVNNVSAQTTTSYEEFKLGADTLVVYKDVPNHNVVPARRLKSDKYEIKIKSAATNNQWINVFANHTYNRSADPEFNNPQFLLFSGQANWHYQTFLTGWSHTYGNIEMSRNTEVEVEISFINGFTIKGQPIFKAAAHPAQKVSSQPVVVGGKIYFKIKNPGQIAIDINGQFDDHHAAISPIKDANGKAVSLHSISFYANPIMKKPSMTDPNVLLVTPGTLPPADLGSKKIVYFKPGVHNLGLNYKLRPNTSYYIPGDAVICGTINNIGGVAQGGIRAGQNINVYGYGTINGWDITHPYNLTNGAYNPDGNNYCPILIEDAVNVEVNGITISDPAFHSIKLQAADAAYRSNAPSGETRCKWIKIVSWRTNGDGIGSAELVEDSFIRTSDDASYIKGARLRIVFWKDTKAAAFHMANIPTVSTSAQLRIEDCDVIYNRTRDVVFKDNCGVFQQRAEGVPGVQTVDLKIRDIRVHDKLSNAPVISLKSVNSPDYGSSYSGIIFENISIMANSAIASPLFPGQTVVKQALIGDSTAKWDGGITFDNVKINDVLLTAANFATYFDLGGLGYPNDNVKNLIFKNSTNYTLTLTPNATGRIISNPAIDKYTVGTNVILTAVPNPGYEFVGWSGDASGAVNPVTIVMNGNKTVSATYQPATSFVFKTPGSGSWTVPAGVTSIVLQSWGGGGAGGSTFNGSATTQNARGGGGAGGSYAKKTITVVAGDVINFTIGKGGSSTLAGFTHRSAAETGGDTFASKNNIAVTRAMGGAGGENVSLTTTGYNGIGGVFPAISTNNGDVSNSGGNGGTANTGSGGGGGSAGFHGAGGAGGVITAGVAGAGGGATGGAGTNSTTFSPLFGNFPGGGGGGSTVRANSGSNIFLAGAYGGTGQLIISINKQLPYLNVNRTIANNSVIDCEQYDEGGQGVAYNDDLLKQNNTAFRVNDKVDVANKTGSSGGKVVTNTLDKEWLEYTVNATAGNYNLKLNYYANSTAAIGDLKVSLDGVLLGTFANVVSKGSWTVRGLDEILNVAIPGGTNRILRLEFIGAGNFDIDSIDFVATTTAKMAKGKASGTDSVVSEFKIYPNPVENILNINFPDVDDSRVVKIFNILGQLVHSRKVLDTSTQIDVKSLNLKGVALVQIDDKNGISGHKVIIN